MSQHLSKAESPKHMFHHLPLVAERRPGKVPAGPNLGPPASLDTCTWLRRILGFPHGSFTATLRTTTFPDALNRTKLHRPNSWVPVYDGRDASEAPFERSALRQRRWKMVHVIESSEAGNKT